MQPRFSSQQISEIMKIPPVWYLYMCACVLLTCRAFVSTKPCHCCEQPDGKTLRTLPTFEEQYKTILSTSGGSTKEQKKGATEEKEADDNGIMEELIVRTAKLAMTSRHTASLSLAATEARQQRGREARLLLHPSDASTGVHL